MRDGARDGVGIGLTIFVLVGLVSLIGESADTTFADAFGALSLVVVSLSAVALYTSWPVYRQVVDPDDDLTTARIGDVVEIEGTLRVDGEGAGVPAPFSRERAPVVSWKVEEYQNGTRRNHYWNEVASGAGATDAVVVTDDGHEATLDVGPLRDVPSDSDTSSVGTATTGQSPGRSDTAAEGGAGSGQEAGLRTSLGRWILTGGGTTFGSVAFDTDDWVELYQFAPSEQAPGHVQRFLDGLGLGPPETGTTLESTDRGTRRASEARLTEGDRVFVRGEVTETGFREATLEPAEQGVTVVSDKTEEEYVADLRRAVYTCATLVTVHGVALSGLLL